MKGYESATIEQKATRKRCVDAVNSKRTNQDAHRVMELMMDDETDQAVRDIPSVRRRRKVVGSVMIVRRTGQYFEQERINMIRNLTEEELKSMGIELTSQFTHGKTEDYPSLIQAWDSLYTKDGGIDKVLYLQDEIDDDERQNMLLDEARVCSACGTEWPAGSIKRQIFEDLQRNCNLQIRKCSQTGHYRLAFSCET